MPKISSAQDLLVCAHIRKQNMVIWSTAEEECVCVHEKKREENIHFIESHANGHCVCSISIRCAQLCPMEISCEQVCDVWSDTNARNALI